MGWTATSVTIVVFGGALVAISVGVGALRKRPEPLAGPLALMMFAVAAWAIPHGISLGFTDVERVVFWNQLRYPGTVVAPVAYLLVALKYAGYERWLSRRTYALLLAIPLVTIAVVWTNQYHTLFWQSAAVMRINGVSVLVAEYGPWYRVNLGYLYFAAIAGIAVLGVTVVRSDPLYRKQSLLMFVGGLVPLVANGIANLGIVPGPAVDYTTTTLALTGLIFAVTLFRLDLLEVRPVARDWLLDELDDGVVVIGPNNRIRDFNPTAVQILGDIAIDQPAAEILPADVVPDGGELVVETDGGRRRYRTRSTALTDDRDREVGRIIHLDDITAIAEREQRISVLNRILRHNIRNELNIVTGQLEMVAAQTERADAEPVETALEHTEQVLRISEKARHLEQSIRGSDANEVVSASAVVDRVASDVRESFPMAAIECTTATAGADAVRVPNETLFEVALVELFENAIEHNDRDPARVTVDVTSDGDRIEISVADNGPGLPDQEMEVLKSPLETQMDHGSGLGLWLVQWTARLSSGSLSFSANDPRGTVVTLALPIPKQ